MFLLLGIVAAQDQHEVLSYFTGLDTNCISGHCGDALSACGDDWKDCHERMSCIKELHNPSKCFNKVKWSQLDSIEVQVLDCAHRNSCLEGGAPGASFLERIAVEKKRLGLDSSADAAQGSGKAKPSSFAQASAEEGMTVDQKVAMDVLSAHLLYMKKTQEMAEQTEALIDSVKNSAAMDNKEKAHALDLLTEHLSVLQEGADEAMAGLGLSDGDESTAVSKKDFQKVVAKLAKEDMLGQVRKVLKKAQGKAALQVALHGKRIAKHIAKAQAKAAEAQKKYLLRNPSNRSM